MSLECHVCPHHCRLSEGQSGRCRARKNIGGKIEDINYGKLTSLALDPIEKKPLYHFYPGSRILSAGSFGCNLSCPFCQNHEISFATEEIRTLEVSPEMLCRLAEEKRGEGNIGVAFTYNEPLVGYEYVRDTSRLVKQAGMKTVLVSNGTATGKVLEEILPFIDAMNIDLKGFTEEYYRDFLGGDLNTVLSFIEGTAGRCHLELTTLIIPGKNDSDREMREISSWIASLPNGTEIPLHISRFFPRNFMRQERPTPVKDVYRLVEVARERLKYVYPGNC